MKRILFLLGCIWLCHFSVAQTDDTVWKPFQAKVENADSVFQGNGYRIITKNFTIPRTKSKIRRFFWTGYCKDEDYYWSLAKSLLGCYEKKKITVSKEGNVPVYSYIKKDYSDSVPVIRTAYIRPVTEYLLSGVAFSKQGEIDSAYQRQLADKIWNNDIPRSIFLPDNNDTIYFPEQKIVNPKISYEKDRYVHHTYRTDLKSFSGGYHKLGGNSEYVYCFWDTFLSEEEMEQTRNNLILDNKKRYKILFEGKDTAIFRGQEIPVDRIVGQYRSFRGGYEINTNYLVKTKIKDMPVLISLKYGVKADSLGGEMPLPPFIEDNIFRLKNVPPALAVIKDSIPSADTLFIAKKNRLPIWTYYDKNTRITGVSIGAGEIDGLRNVTTNGIKLDVIGPSLILALMPPSFLVPSSVLMDLKERATQMEELPILYKNRFSTTNGISFSVAGSIMDSHIINGIGFGGLLTINYRSNGISIAGLNNGLFYNNGLQIGGIWACARKSNGMQIGVLGVHGDKVRGVQIGAFNFVTERISGFQAGLFNTAVKSSGLQIGLFNRSNKLKGFQIGLWNKSDRRSLPFFNCGFN